MIKFTELLERVKSEKIAIHTATKDQAVTLLKELDKKGYKWANGKKTTTETWYGVWLKDTCYNFKPNNEVRFCSFNWYKNEGFTIVECSDIDF